MSGYAVQDSLRAVSPATSRGSGLGRAFVQVLCQSEGLLVGVLLLAWARSRAGVRS